MAGLFLGYANLAEFRKSILLALFGLVLGFRVPGTAFGIDPEEAGKTVE